MLSSFSLSVSPISHHQTNPTPSLFKKRWKIVTSQANTKGSCLCLYSQKEQASRQHKGNSFIGVLLDAYNNHYAISIRPDNVWLSIAIAFADYVDNHAEKTRSIFVTHQKRNCWSWVLLQASLLLEIGLDSLITTLSLLFVTLSSLASLLQRAKTVSSDGLRRCAQYKITSLLYSVAKFPFKSTTTEWVRRIFLRGRHCQLLPRRYQHHPPQFWFRYVQSSRWNHQGKNWLELRSPIIAKTKVPL